MDLYSIEHAAEEYGRTPQAFEEVLSEMGVDPVFTLDGKPYFFDEAVMIADTRIMNRANFEPIHPA
jgi:hypothetical protein